MLVCCLQSHFLFEKMKFNLKRCICILFIQFIFANCENVTLEDSNSNHTGPGNVTENKIVKEPEPAAASTSTEESIEGKLVAVDTSANSQELTEHHLNNARLSELITSNQALASRIALLENKIAGLEASLASTKHEIHFHHPTKEVQFVDMQVVQWTEAVKNNLRKISIQFQAGYSLGAVSTWEFSLANESDHLTVNLLLVEEKYGKGALFAGFTAYVLDTEGNLFSQANALPVNFLDGNGRNLHLPNVIGLDEIRNSSNGLLTTDDIFKIRFKLELLGVGHKLYTSAPIAHEISTKDAQTVVFDIDNLFSKISKRLQNTSVPADAPLAYTRFTLKHELWHMDTFWIAELHHTGTGENEAISLYIMLDKSVWPELYASFNVEVWDFLTKRIILTQATPINNFAKDRITIEPLLMMNQLKEMYDEDEPVGLRFKLQFVVYGKNARYYADVN